MQVKFKKLDSSAYTPTYGTDGAAAFDLYACTGLVNTGRATVKTGLAFEIPQGYAMIIKPRSGLAFKEKEHAFSGTIDSDYRGEVKVLLVAEDPEQIITVHPGQRIAQAIVLPLPRITFQEVTELSDTLRGAGGFGHTG
jgi:dUTP pyrophosphatase